MDFTSHGFSEKGPVRDENQDSFFNSDKRRIYAVADGMGGEELGAHASGLAVTTIHEQSMSFGNTDDPSEFLRDAFSLANHRVFTQLASDRRPGTTLVAVAISDKSAALASVGDSRCYLIRQSLRHAELLTIDENLATELRIETDEYRHQLTNAIGIKPFLDVSVNELTVEEGDRLLLCTDGLYSNFNDDEIFSLIATGLPADATMAALRKELLNREPSDNGCGLLIEAAS